MRSRSAGGYSNKDPLRANRQLCFCLPALTLCYLVLRRAPVGAGSLRRVNIHLGSAPETRTRAPPSLCVRLMRRIDLRCFKHTVSSLTRADIPSSSVSLKSSPDFVCIFGKTGERRDCSKARERMTTTVALLGNFQVVAARSVPLALERRRKLPGSALPGPSIVWDIMKALSAS